MDLNKTSLLKLWAQLQAKADKYFQSGKRERYLKALSKADVAYVVYLEA